MKKKTEDIFKYVIGALVVAIVIVAGVIALRRELRRYDPANLEHEIEPLSYYEGTIEPPDFPTPEPTPPEPL